MPYVVKGINRKTGRPTEFTCNVSTEPLARMAADVRGIDVESCTSLEEPRVDELATAAPTDVDPVESPAGRKPDVREWRLIEPQPQARSPRKRCAGVAFAALGLCLAVFYGFDLHAAMAIRDDARLSRRVLGANVRSDYELTFPNHHSVNHSTQETLAATQNRIHFDGFMALLGAVLLVGGLGMYKANISPSRRDHVG